MPGGIAIAIAIPGGIALTAIPGGIASTAIPGGITSTAIPGGIPIPTGVPYKCIRTTRSTKSSPSYRLQRRTSFPRSPPGADQEPRETIRHRLLNPHR